jgi:hypothetical protein
MPLFNSSVPTADRIGVGLSALCLIHCLALPALLAALSVWAVAAEAVHAALALGVVPVATWAGVRGYRHHRRVLVPVLFAVGAALLLGALAFEGMLREGGHTGLTVIGGSLLIVGHVLNVRWGALRC